jgi:hypothetical protein
LNLTSILTLYVLLLALTFGASWALGNSRAGKLSRRAFTLLTLGLIEALKWAIGKIKGQ